MRRQHGRGLSGNVCECVCFSYNLGFQGWVIQLGVVKVPLGKVHVDLTQEAVPAKGVVVPHGENERLGSEVLHANTILQRQRAGRFCSAIVSRAAIANKPGVGKCDSDAERAAVSYSEDLVKWRAQRLLFHRRFSLPQVGFVRKQVAFHVPCKRGNQTTSLITLYSSCSKRP